MKDSGTSIIAKLVTFFSMFLLTYPVFAKHIYVDKLMFGREEKILIFKEKLKFTAKLDTGAKTSSLSAIGIKEYELDGKTWVAFQIMDASSKRLINKQFPLVRRAFIKQHHQGKRQAKSTKRPVVLLPVCLDKQYKFIEFNLVDRRHFLYPVLFGKDALILFNAVIDPTKRFTSSPTCESMS